MLVAVFGDAHGHAEALDAVLAAAESGGAEQRWSLGDMVGGGPDPAHAVERTRASCAVALLGNHDYGATGSIEPARFGAPGVARRAVDRARAGAARRGRARVDALAAAGRAARRRAVLAREPAQRRPRVRRGVERGGVPGGPARRARARRPHPRPGGVPGGRAGAAHGRSSVTAGRGARHHRGQWLLNPGAVGAPPVAAGWWDGLDAQARPRSGSCSTWSGGSRRGSSPRSIPAPARERARALGLD